MDILDIFYNQLIPEASTGRVNCYLYCNTYFNTYIIEEEKLYEVKEKYSDVIIPTLIIKDKKYFDSLLIRYVKLAKDFYKDDNYIKIVSGANSSYIDKIIMTLLWSNATIEDFNDPINFLRKRISFFENSLDESKLEYGYSEILDSNIELKIKKDILANETPYKMVFSLSNKENNNYYFPEVKFGINDGIVYIYAVQNRSHVMNDYTKKINRSLYKIGEGFDTAKDNYEMYEEGNLKDVSASFLVVLNMALAYFKNNGYSKFVIPSILPVRWNAKSIAVDRASKNIEDDKEEQQRIQKNLTDKFIRTFLRLTNHYEGMDVIAYPYEMDSNLTIALQDELNCTNSLLRETFEIIGTNKKSHKL